MQSANIEEARRTLGDLVDRAHLAGEPTLITRNGRPRAVMVSTSWYEQAEKALAVHGSQTAQEGEQRP